MQQTDVVLNIGHTSLAPGAKNKKTGITEFMLNSIIAPQIKYGLESKGYIVEVLSGAYWRLPSRINKINPKLCISLHCNGFSNPSVRGKEWLYSNDEGQELAAHVRHAFNDLHTKNRGMKKIVKGDRGFSLLNKTNCPIIIAEPIFITNDEDVKLFVTKADKVINYYVDSILTFLEK